MSFSALITPSSRPIRRLDARVAVALTVGESDSSGRSGVPMDLRVFASMAVHGVCALTAVRAAALRRALGLLALPPEAIQRQLLAVVEDHAVDAVKVGFVGSEDGVQSMCEVFDTHPPANLVVDPELATASGHPRLPSEALHAIKGNLMPRALVAVVNAHEAELITGRRAEDRASMREACRRIRGLSVSHVLLTGGRIEGHAVDQLYDGDGFLEFGHDRLPREGLRGIGACLSAGIAAQLARGCSLPEAIDVARQVVIEAIAARLPLTLDSSVLDPLVQRFASLALDATPQTLTTPEEEDDPELKRQQQRR